MHELRRSSHTDRQRLTLWAAALALVWSNLAPTGATAAVSAQVDPDVVLRLTSPTQNERLTGRVRISGYAADRRGTSPPGINERDIRIYLNDDQDEGNLLAYAVGGQASDEATAQLGAAFNRSGFAQPWETCTFPSGRHRLIVWVSSLATPGARNRAAVDVDINPCDAGTTVLRNDFSNRPGGVDVLHREGGGGMVQTAAPIVADFAVGIDARCTVASDACSYTLGVRRLPGPGELNSDTMYTLSVNPQRGTFALSYWPEGTPRRAEALIGPTRSAAIVPGDGTNRLAVIAQGDWLRAFINGEPVGEAHDSRRRWGRITWSVTNGGTGTIDAEFARLLISTPGDPQTLNAVR